MILNKMKLGISCQLLLLLPEDVIFRWYLETYRVLYS